MRLIVAAVGRLKSGPEAELVRDYAARIRAGGRRVGVTGFSLSEIDAPRGLDRRARLTREAERLAAAAPANAKRIVLDERGESRSSEDFAKLLAKWRDGGAPAACFFIGGADGLSPSIRDSADATLAFGLATWPHMLVRAMLCEQIYRAMTILAGHPYHRA